MSFNDALERVKRIHAALPKLAAVEELELTFRPNQPIVIQGRINVGPRDSARMTWWGIACPQVDSMSDAELQEAILFRRKEAMTPP